ncbi:MAG: TldD/PmbA family protein [Chloroflexi bacterium]|uniref:TldD/PmbA family protein n=1 Tax=Candidatus Chlorohelix allophototropha TaxID=3003348 RepID=A0A8T7MAD2_9CHLR|nr:TldD/PmbA family protein [Chloroflexota bacterium]WJW69017.1 TldD/PmbA family protein [Chloroflexota bacterium L227-S17]
MENTELDLNLAETVVKKALAAGADEVEVLFSQGYESGVKLRKGKVDLLNEAQPKALSLRLYREKRAAVAYTSDFSKAALDDLVMRAMDMAVISDPDPAAGLPDPDDLAFQYNENLGIWDPAIGDIPTEVKVEMVRRCEDSAFAFDTRINNTGGTTFSTNLRQVGLVNSLGFAGTYKTSHCSFGLDAVVDDAEGKKQNGWWFTISNNFKEMKSPEEVGRIAAQRAINKIGGRKIKTSKMPIIWDPMVASDLLGTLAGSLSGDALERRSTFLIPFEGQKIGSDLVTLVDDPLRPGLRGTRPFDGEGVEVRRKNIFDKGVFQGFIFNSYTARKTSHKTTGNATGGIGSLPGVGVSNFYIEPGNVTQEEIIAGVEEGLFLTEMIGFGYNPVTGDFSRGAVGWWIENGKLAYPVAEINIAGNMKDMLSNITQVGNDLEFLFSISSPTIRIDNMTVSGL